MRKLVIWGASGHALVVADIIRLCKEYELIGFIDSINLEHHQTEFCGSKILGGQEQLNTLPALGIENIILAIGDCQARLKLSNLVSDRAFRLATAIHPQSTVARDVSIGAGSVICAGAVISPGVKIGQNVIINTSASIDHECSVEDGVHIGPGVHIGGRTTIEKGAWIAIGATVVDRIKIGEFSIVGAGSLVLNDIPKGVVAYGIPAKAIRKVEQNDY